jgi:multidrug efflux pump subunit AcrA (membrane-fusion protein)
MDKAPSIIVLSSLRHRGKAIVRAWTLRACAGFCVLWAVQAAAQRSVDQVAAYGRVSPGERAVTLTAPSYLNSPPVVAELFVKEGDHVARHQKLAVTQSQLLASADLAIAKAHLSTAEERLQALNAETEKPGDCCPGGTD